MKNINIKLIINILFTIVLTTVIIRFQKQKLYAQDNNLSQEVYQQIEVKEKLNASFLKKTPVFGFNNLVSNWAFIKFLLYFGDGEVRKNTGYSVIPDYFETVVKNDPRFVKAYFYLSPANSLFAGKPEQGNALMTEGLKKIKPETSEESYFLWMYKAVDELLFLGDSEAARKSYLMAAEWADQIGDKRSKTVAARARQTAQFLQNNPDSTGAQISSWFMLLSNAKDDATRKQVIKKIEELGGEIIVSPDGMVQVKVPQKNINKNNL